MALPFRVNVTYSRQKSELCRRLSRIFSVVDAQSWVFMRGYVAMRACVTSQRSGIDKYFAS